MHVVLAMLPPPVGTDCPSDARGFRWQLPQDVGMPDAPLLKAWHPDTGEELEGSPVALPATLPGGTPEAEVPLARWPGGLAGFVGAAMPTRIASGLYVAVAGPTSMLRFEMLELPGTMPRRGVRLRAASTVQEITAHLHLPTPPPPGVVLPFEVTAWLPEAHRVAAQAQLEIWLTRREAAGVFTPLRRLRRGRIFRQPSALSAELEILPEDMSEAIGLWITLVLRDAGGLCLLPPTASHAAPETEGLEDRRLHGSFALLARMAHLHMPAGASQAPALPSSTAPTHPMKAPHAAARDATHPFTEIILPVYNGGAVIRDCLRALRLAATGPSRVIVVDDGSRGYTAEMVRQEVANDPLFRLHRRDTNRGYTKSINEGVLLAEAPWVVVLNSDTLVPRGWLDRLHAAARARAGTGMVGPLSNAASWQSIPQTKRPDGGWSTNDLIAPRHLEKVQALLAEASERTFPEFPLLNGFATLISREVFDTVGLYDEEAFPMGYGEETDLCLRARGAGFRLTVADDCFVFHHKSLSFGGERQRLTRAGNLELVNKHPGVNMAALEAQMQASAPLGRLRARMEDALAGLD